MGIPKAIIIVIVSQRAYDNSKYQLMNKGLKISIIDTKIRFKISPFFQLPIKYLDFEIGLEVGSETGSEVAISDFTLVKMPDI